MEGGRIALGTKKIYSSKAIQITTFFQRHSKLRSVINDDGTIDYSLITSEHISELFGYISVKRNRQGIEIVTKHIQAYETVSSYWSAMKYTAAEAHMELDNSIEL